MLQVLTLADTAAAAVPWPWLPCAVLKVLTYVHEDPVVTAVAHPMARLAIALASRAKGFVVVPQRPCWD